MLRVNQNDVKILIDLAEYRVLTVDQLTVLHFSGKHVARRRLRQLVEAGLVEDDQNFDFRYGRGRPENLFSLSREGIQFLSDKSLLNRMVSPDLILGENLHCLAHQILINWFRLHLIQIEKNFPQLKVYFLSSTSPFQLREPNDIPRLYEISPGMDAQEEEGSFIPDGVFSIKDIEQQKSVLFFLEVDRGTELLISSKLNPKDIRQKILHYQTYFRSQKYQRYEPILQAAFNGFRLLFLVNSPTRFQNLCRLVQEMPPADFIWVTDQEKMFSQGLADVIWARGGKFNDPLQSILGNRRSHPSPVLPIKD